MLSDLAGRVVLAVEDEMLVAWMLQDMLADLGCSVVGPAARVDEALALIASIPLDAAVLDLNLNGELSYPIADALAARGVPFMFATGYDKSRLLEAYRIYPVLQKPYYRSELGYALTLLLEAREVSAQAVTWALASG